MPINNEKILKELAKGSPAEQHETYLLVKQVVTQTLQEEQAKKEQEANDLQSKIDRLNNIQ